MRAITVEPKKPGSAKWEEVPEPDVSQVSILVEAIAVGVCGTDVEIVEGKYGWPPPGKTRLILGHASLGRVLETDPAGGFKTMNALVSDLSLALPQERHAPLQQYKQKLNATIARAFQSVEDKQQASIEDRQGLGHPRRYLG